MEALERVGTSPKICGEEWGQRQECRPPPRWVSLPVVTPSRAEPQKSSQKCKETPNPPHTRRVPVGSDPSRAPREWQRHLHGHQRGVPRVLLPAFGISHEAASPEVWLTRGTPGPAAPRASFGASSGRAVSHPLPAGTRATTCPGTAPGRAWLPPAATTVASSLSSALPPLFRPARSRGCLPAPAPLPARSAFPAFPAPSILPGAPSRAAHGGS